MILKRKDYISSKDFRATVREDSLFLLIWFRVVPGVLDDLPSSEATGYEGCGSREG
jgi:hypothetical protein